MELVVGRGPLTREEKSSNEPATATRTEPAGSGTAVDGGTQRVPGNAECGLEEPLPEPLPKLSTQN